MGTHDDEDINYVWIKQMARERGVSVTDLIALAPQNDPFYTGTPNDRALGEWFAEVWYRLGEARTHLRRVHYYLVSLGAVTFPNGKPYENTVECWDVLNLASKAARYLRLVDPEAFNDRRTPEVRLFAPGSVEPPTVQVYSSSYRLDNMRMPEFPALPWYSVESYEAEQPYHLEVWCEKSTMNDVLEPLCERYRANLQTGMGEMSITATLALVRRLQQAGKPSRILYVSDFDPAGQSMPVAVSRKIEYFVRTFGLDLDIRLYPVVLTLPQVQYYQLPRTPIKESERRRVGFEQRHGEGAVELDALEALHPGQLDVILSRYLEQYYDTSLFERVYQQRRYLEEELEAIRGRVAAAYKPQIAELRREYDQMRSELDGRLRQLGERLRGVWQAMSGEMAQYAGVLQEYPVPLADVEGDVFDGLYDSTRGYLEQVEAYKLFQGRREEEVL